MKKNYTPSVLVFLILVFLLIPSLGQSQIHATNDSATTTNGSTTTVVINNVLATDTLNGLPVSLSQVTLTQVSTTNNYIHLDTATGNVIFSNGPAPLNYYTIYYEICDIAHPGNCSTATVSVSIHAPYTSPPLQANYDEVNATNGLATTVVIHDVLANDTLNGLPVSLSQVTLSQVSTTNNYIHLDPSTGAVIFSNGPAPLGTQTIFYQFCEIANPTQCSALGSIVVHFGTTPQNTIHAVNDLGTIANGPGPIVAINDVLANDTINGLPVTLSQVILTQVTSTNNYLHLDPANGHVNFTNGPASSPGTYSLQYQICEVAHPYNCSTASVSVNIGCTIPSPVISSITHPNCVSQSGAIMLTGLPTSGSWSIYYTITRSNYTFPYIIIPVTGATMNINIPYAIGELNVYLSNNSGCLSPPTTITLGYLDANLQGTYVDYNNNGITDVGDVINYQCIVSNLSDCTLFNTTVTGDTMNFSGNPLATLLPQTTDSTTFSYTYVITQNDINNGVVQKTATVSNTGGTITMTTNTNLNITDGIQLVAFLDANSNGVKDSSEQYFTIGEYHLELNNDGVVHNIASNGAYYVYENNPTNSYHLTFSINPAYALQYSVSPSSYSNITVANGSGVTTYNFAVTAIPFNDLAVYVTPYGSSPRPGFRYYNSVVYQNNGTSTIPSGTVTFTKDNLLTVVSVSQTGTVSNPNGFTYNFTNLLPHETRSFIVDMQVPTIPTVALGNFLTNAAAITIPAADINTANNTSHLTQTIIGSYDPNDKAESHGGKVLFSTFTANDYLTYTIRFENAGTANAVNIRVSDVLDAKLDETSVRMISASHTYTLERVNKTLTWKFDGIELPPSVANTAIGKGFVTFQVKPKPGFILGDNIPNTAAIFFDFNPAIVTNTCTTQFVSVLATADFAFNQFTYYPNPVKNSLTISNASKIESVSVTSVLGQEVLVKKVNDLQTELDLSVLSKGVYFVKVKSLDQEKTVKIIKE
jgi:uncharacterized repeat protein (TIGR01451 family)